MEVPCRVPSSIPRVRVLGCGPEAGNSRESRISRRLGLPTMDNRKCAPAYVIFRVHRDLQACDELLRAPVPALATTLQRYVDSLVAVVSPAQLEATRRIVRDFAGSSAEQGPPRDDGEGAASAPAAGATKTAPLGPLLQEKLRLFASSRDNWVCMFAARFIEFAVLFKRKIDNGTLRPDVSRSRGGGQQPLCMQTYRHFFPAYRRPGPNKDDLLLDTAMQQQDHVIVVCRDQLLSIKRRAKDPSERQPPVGILTTENRRTWSNLYVKLSRSNVNQCSLQSLETCLLVVCLDRPLNLRRHYATIRRESFTLDWAAQAAHLLHGESNTPGEGNAANRWYDKFMQASIDIVVSRDGVNGLIIEHSGSDGVTVLRFCEEFLDFVQEHSVCSSARRESGDTSLYPVSRLSWDLNEDMLKAIQEASKSLGKVHRKLVSTYESASLRKFHLGRVDNIRAATSEALTWIQAMCDAVPASTVNGEGPDNHLLGLREMARLHEKTVPLFEDKSYADFLRFRLSTSQEDDRIKFFQAAVNKGTEILTYLATEKSILVGYGPVVPDGYGCSYNICPAHVDFCVSSFFSSPETSSDFFALSLEGSLLQMRELCIKRAQKDAENNAVLPPTAS
ncbi:choline O-acyltransferase, putative [Ixodes scapularis]|uniref:Choline O-acetyltransferase n=1 Tax=Ixodes scapularis TaxID=6945 RepID=B7QD11_IXOSC|nr:choline O-acyltransferase, putative [Ixodes scapularis]|eukprot:XP_002413425.1 choline O-acyltransferase, putative [Ixodes scapularis]